MDLFSIQWLFCCMNDRVQLGWVHMEDFHQLHVRHLLWGWLEIVHDDHEVDVDERLDGLDLDFLNWGCQNWECLQWVLDSLQGSDVENVRGLILIFLKGHAKVSHVEIHPSDLHVLRD